MNPCGTTGAVLSWMEYPWPVAEKCAVIPFTVWLIGNGEWSGALSKSNSTTWAETWKNCEITLKRNKVMQVVKIELHFPGTDSEVFFKYRVFMTSNIKVYVSEIYAKIVITPFVVITIFLFNFFILKES
jgi:hypothetical protein